MAVVVQMGAAACLPKDAASSRPLPAPHPHVPGADASSTQGMGLGDMFRRGADGQLQPVLQELQVPVRAVVLPIADAQAAR